MSCKNCNDMAEAMHVGGGNIMFVRWKNANVGVIACDEHAREILVALTDAKANNANKAEVVTDIERVVFLLVDSLRDEVMNSGRVDQEDIQFLAKFYDDRRGRGW